MTFTKDKPPLTRPADFFTFWNETLDTVDPAIARGYRDTRQEGLAYIGLTFRSWGDALIRGYMLRWYNDTPRPLIVHTHGYYGRCQAMWLG